MSRFIILHNSLNGRKEILVNTETICVVSDGEFGALVSFGTKVVYVTETVDEIKEMLGFVEGGGE